MHPEFETINTDLVFQIQGAHFKTISFLSQFQFYNA